jgi:uncharacterized protein YoxC
VAKTADELDADAAGLYQQIQAAANEKDDYMAKHRKLSSKLNDKRDQLLGEAAALHLVAEMPAAEQQAVAAALAKVGN